MCSPTLAISAASAVYGAYQQNQVAKAEQSAYTQNYTSEVAATKEQSAQVDAQAADKMTARAKEAMIQQSRINAAAADSGIAGISVDAQHQDASMVAGMDMATIEANRQASQRQLSRQLTGARNTTTTRLAGIKRPSAVGVGLQIAGAYYADKKTNTPVTGK